MPAPRFADMPHHHTTALFQSRHPVNTLIWECADIGYRMVEAPVRRQRYPVLPLPGRWWDGRGCSGYCCRRRGHDRWDH